MTDDETPRPLELRDLDWVVDLTSRRRERLLPHAPTFWRPSQDATARHRSFLRHLIDDSEVCSVRTGHGYLMALRRGPRWVVDDMAMDDPGFWMTEGVTLLRYVLDRCGPIRFVVPAFETDRLQAATAVGLAPAEQWWHRDLDPQGPGDEADPLITVDGASGRLVPAPPVYDPGGPVLLVSRVDSPDALRRIEAAGARRSATVSVVTQAVPDPGLARMLADAGYLLTTIFCDWAMEP